MYCWAVGGAAGGGVGGIRRIVIRLYVAYVQLYDSTEGTIRSGDTTSAGLAVIRRECWRLRLAGHRG